MKYLIGAVAIIGLGLVGAILYSYSGIYDVAATQPHTRVGAWFLDNTMHHSVRARADDIEVPDDLHERVSRGAGHFRETCVPCHGAAGTHGEAGGDMRPEPPPLRSAAKEWNPNEVFWIVKHGIKMTAMPSFAAMHSDSEIWDIVAFVEQLPEMSPERYAQLTGSGTPDVRHSVFGRDDPERAQSDPEVTLPNRERPAEADPSERR